MKILESKNLVAPEAIGIVYSRDLRKLVKAMVKDYKSLIAIYRDKKDQITTDADEVSTIAKLDSIETWAKAQGYKTKNRHIANTGSGYIDIEMPVKSKVTGVKKWIRVRISDHYSKQGKIKYNLLINEKDADSVVLSKLKQLEKYASGHTAGEIVKLRTEIPRQEPFSIKQVVAGAWLTTAMEERLKTLDVKWQEKFAEFAELKSKQVVTKVLKANDVQLKRALIHFFSNERFELIGKVIPNSMRQIMKASIAENVSYIKSIQSEFHTQIAGAVYRSISGAGSIDSLKDVIQIYSGKSEKRANLIALDQTRKMYTALNYQRFKQLGIKKAMWIHTHAGKTVRPYHYRKWDGVSGLKDGHPNGLNGFIFDIDNPPVIQEETKTQPEIRGLPAQLPFCTCAMRAIIEE